MTLQDEGGHTYFYNPVTEVSSWERPNTQDVNSSRNWAEYRDEWGRTYYHNSVTTESSWDKPAGFVAAAKEQQSKPRDVISVPRHQSLDAGLAMGEAGASSAAADDTLHKLIWSRHAAAGRTRKLSMAATAPREAMANWQKKNGGRAAALHARSQSAHVYPVSGRVTDV